MAETGLKKGFGFRYLKSAHWNSVYPVDSMSIRLCQISWIETLDQFSYTKKPGTEAFTLIYVLSGSGELFYRDLWGSYKKDEVILLHSKEGYMLRAKSRCVVIYVEVNGSLVQQLYPYMKRHHQNPVFEGNMDIIALCEEVYRIASSEKPGMSSDLDLSTLMYRLFGLINIAPARHAQTQEALNYIHSHYSENITNEQLAKECSLSKFHFIRCFTAENGETPVSYLNNLRIEKAKDLIATTTKPMSVISSEVGFQSGSYFSKIFLNKTGLSPKEYRRKFH